MILRETAPVLFDLASCFVSNEFRLGYYRLRKLSASVVRKALTSIRPISDNAVLDNMCRDKDFFVCFLFRSIANLLLYVTRFPLFLARILSRPIGPTHVFRHYRPTSAVYVSLYRIYLSIPFPSHTLHSSHLSATLFITYGFLAQPSFAYSYDMKCLSNNCPIMWFFFQISTMSLIW